MAAPLNLQKGPRKPTPYLENRKAIYAFSDSIENDFRERNRFVDSLLSAFGPREGFTEDGVRVSETACVELLSRKVVLMNKTVDIAHALCDRMPPHFQGSDAVWETIKSMVSEYQNPATTDIPLFANPDPEESRRFRKAVREAYGDGVDDKAWCVISGTKLHSARVKTARVVPLELGENNAAHLFGNPDRGQCGHLSNPSNGLPMRSDYKQLFDAGAIAFRPVPGSDDLKILVLVESSDSEVIALHGKVLKFPNAMRPARNYLYFAFLATLARRQRYDRCGWWIRLAENGLEELQVPGHAKGFLRRSTMIMFAHRFGRMSPFQANLFVLGPRVDLDYPPQGTNPADPRLDMDNMDEAVTDWIYLLPHVTKMASTDEECMFDTSVVKFWASYRPPAV